MIVIIALTHFECFFLYVCCGSEVKEANSSQSVRTINLRRYDVRT